LKKAESIQHTGTVSTVGVLRGEPPFLL
jgi:hypothetical protein